MERMLDIGVGDLVRVHQTELRLTEGVDCLACSVPVFSLPLKKACILSADFSSRSLHTKTSTETTRLIWDGEKEGKGVRRWGGGGEREGDYIPIAALSQPNRAQELCESRGGRPGLPPIISLQFLWT